MPAETSLGIASFAGVPDADITVSEASVSKVSIAPVGSYFQWLQKIIVQAGAGPYTYQCGLFDSLQLGVTNVVPLEGAIFRVRFEFEQSTNPTIEIYDDIQVGGNLLQTITGPEDQPAVFLFEAEYDGVSFKKYDGRYVI